ncbi:MAG: apolipoprotein N-acyltransferase [Bacteroidales bacterium]|nr:apolipoprotein N-acyltransferase [Bacteroidales bacterium]
MNQSDQNISVDGMISKKVLANRKINKVASGIIFSIITGLLLAYSIAALNSYLAWIAFVPLLLAVYDKSLKESLLPVTAFTLAFGLVGYWWIPFTVQRYTGSFTMAGVAGMFAMIFSNLLLFFTWITVFKYLQIPKNNTSTGRIIYNTVLISVLYFLLEFLNINTFTGIPWNKINLRNTVASNVYFIQMAALVGSVGLSLFIISVNYLLAVFIKTRNRKALWIAAGIFSIHLLYGIIIVSSHVETGNKKRIALVCENVKAETKWTEQGDAIISKMFQLIKEAKHHDPQLIVWPESALPWTYRENDDILLAIAEILKGGHTQNMIGYLTQAEHDPNFVYNSEYLIDEAGKAIGRYDKHILLDFIEKPFLSNDYSKLLPMLARSYYDNVLPGRLSDVLHTNIGRCKVDICNESLIPDYFGAGENPFEFITNISNDAWFEGNQNIKHHFYLTRLKAVEQRKFIIINSNRGISGIVDDYGNIQVSGQSDKPAIISGYIIPNSKRTLFARFPLLMPLLAMAGMLFFIFKKVKLNNLKINN